MLPPLPASDRPETALGFRSVTGAMSFAGGPFTHDPINRLIKRIGARVDFAFPVHAHMLRHACGYALANAGHDTRAIQDWLGFSFTPDQ